MALTACIILLCLALALSFYPIFPGAVPAYLAMFSLKWAGLQYSHDFSNSTLTFWGIAVFIVLGITSLLPKPLAQSTRGLGFIAGGAMAGTAAGMAVSAGASIAGSLIGASLGALAYNRTHSGAALKFPSSQFVQYLCAKGLPAAVTMSISSIVILSLINHIPTQ